MLKLLTLLCTIIFVNNQLKHIFLIFLVYCLNHLNISVLEMFVMSDKRKHERTVFFINKI